MPQMSSLNWISLYVSFFFFFFFFFVCFYYKNLNLFSCSKLSNNSSLISVSFYW